MYSLQNRRAVVLKDGRIHHQADVVTSGSLAVFGWSCACAPSDGHEHDGLHAKIADRLTNRHERIDALHALEGKKARIGVVSYVVTDCTIQIHGPALWRLYVAWDQQALGHPEKVHKTYSADYDDPKHCITPERVVETIEGWCRVAGNDYAKALRMAGDFVSA